MSFACESVFALGKVIEEGTGEESDKWKIRVIYIYIYARAMCNCYVLRRWPSPLISVSDIDGEKNGCQDDTDTSGRG